MQFHIDPLNLLVVIAGFVGMWLKGRNANLELLTKLQVSVATLTKIAEALEGRVDRIERRIDK